MNIFNSIDKIYYSTFPVQIIKWRLNKQRLRYYPVEYQSVDEKVELVVENSGVLFMLKVRSINGY